MCLRQWEYTSRVASGWKWRRAPTGSQATVIGRSDLDAGEAADRCQPQCSAGLHFHFLWILQLFFRMPNVTAITCVGYGQKSFLFLSDTQMIMLRHIVSVMDFKAPWLTSSRNNKAVTGVPWAIPETTPQRFATHNRGCTWKATSNDQFWLKTFVFFKSSISSRSDHNESETL